MKIDLKGLISAFSYGLDAIESEFVGVSTNHSKRVAYISYMLGKKLELTQECLSDLFMLACMHDNALTEYIALRKNNRDDLSIHCIMGEKNINSFPFQTDVKNAILYHHERENQTGPFHIKSSQTPVYAQIIHMADELDATIDLSNGPKIKENLLKFLNLEGEKIYSPIVLNAFYKLDINDLLNKITNTEIFNSLTGIDHEMIDLTFEQIKNVMGIFAKIVDYKSLQTSAHSVGIANKALDMARFYKYDEEKTTRLFIAASLHDIGKLAISNKVLDKPDKLTDIEFKHMKNHAYYTYFMLNKISDFSDITQVASNHHEKLNGKGYPFGKTMKDLNFDSRLLGCIDIYQALTEKRSYKAGFSHDKSIQIMKEMALRNEIDGNIVNDIAQNYA